MSPGAGIELMNRGVCMANVAFVGLGVMGYPMAGHLARAGHEVTVYNRSAEKAAAWVAEYGGRACATPAEAAAEQDFVMVCVGNDQDLLQVVDGLEGILAGARTGTVIVDHTTRSEEHTSELQSRENLVCRLLLE